MPSSGSPTARLAGVMALRPSNSTGSLRQGTLPHRGDTRTGSKPSVIKIHLPLGQVSQMAFGLRRLSKQLNLPFEETHRAVKVFVEFTGVPQSQDVVDATMSRPQFKDCLRYVMQVRGASEEMSKQITERSFNTCDRDGNGTIDVEEFCLWYASESFSKEMMLDEKTHDLRTFAAEHCIPLSDLDKYQSYFKKFDTDGSGGIDYEEFCQLVTMLWKIPKNLQIPESRLRSFWATADLDGGGCMDFQEFVLWYRKYCESPSGDDPITGFYRSIRSH
eukprot:TRINITY_DN6131_c1_g1_i3.p1 TRINITY_DN6131_c1_g1~~TRINITY_DN6131_c1_g1_i3.p1  ORF type:complete len:275 (+),score=44.52 TRINITY_DN6131_c1_g1_i3:66-890(+)